MFYWRIEAYYVNEVILYVTNSSLYGLLSYEYYLFLVKVILTAHAVGTIHET